MGDVELLTVGLYNKCMDVNFYGAVRTMRRFLYLVREKKGIDQFRICLQDSLTLFYTSLFKGDCEANLIY